MNRYEAILSKHPQFKEEAESYITTLNEKRLFSIRVGETQKYNRCVFLENTPTGVKNISYLFTYLGYRQDRYNNILCLGIYIIHTEILEILREAGIISAKEFQELYQKVYSM